MPSELTWEEITGRCQQAVGMAISGVEVSEWLPVILDDFKDHSPELVYKYFNYIIGYLMASTVQTVIVSGTQLKIDPLWLWAQYAKSFADNQAANND